MNWEELYQRFSDTLDMRRLDDTEFMELKARLPRQRTVDLARLREDRAGDKWDEERFQWLHSLVKYNEFLREDEEKKQKLTLESQADPSAGPQNREQAQRIGYVSAADVLKVMPDIFHGHARLNSYLNRHPQIRTYKPGGSRKMIHAGDLIRQLASEADRSFEGLDREGVEGRKESVRKKREEERK